MPRHSDLLSEVSGPRIPRPSRRFLTGGLLASAAVFPSAVSLAATTAKKKIATDPAREARRQKLAAVTSWAYQLRLLNFPEIAASRTDLVVIDHALSDGLSFINQFDPKQIEALKTWPDGRRRLVLSYLSIGEAERYRFYWKPEWFEPTTKPAWLGEMNPRWYGNYPVEYWHAEWQNLFIEGPDSYLARIQAQGFDGIYLDRADVFQETGKRHTHPARAMAEFIGKLAATARATDPNFLVVMQNAEELIAQPIVRDSIDAIAKEDLYFGINHSERANTPEAVQYSERDLLKAKAAGKRIFVVEYLTDAAKIDDADKRAREKGFLPHFAPRLLGSLVTDPMSLTPTYTGPLVPQEGSSTRLGQP